MKYQLQKSTHMCASYYTFLQLTRNRGVLVLVKLSCFARSREHASIVMLWEFAHVDVENMKISAKRAHPWYSQ